MMLNGKYRTKVFVDDTGKGLAKDQLEKFLNQSGIESDQIINVSICTTAVDNAMRILLVYIEAVNPYGAHAMGMY